VYQYQGDLAQALDFYRRALLIHETVGNEGGMGATFHAMGTALFELQQFPQAEEQLYNAIARWENLRPGLQDEYKVSLADLQSETYELLLRVLIAQNKPDEALEIAERGRARAFIELLATNFKDNPPSIAPPSMAEIQVIAQQQQATLVEYALSEEEVYIWVINPDGQMAFRSVPLKPILGTRSLEALVKSTRDGMFIEPYYPGEELQTLHEILITPIADLLPTDPEEKVIFIPQDSLFLVPFVALLDQEERYLIESHTILTAPSIQVLALTHQQRVQNRQKNPTNSLVVGFPRDPQAAKDLVLGNPTMPINLQTGSPLAPLSGAEEEAQQIATFLNTKALIGPAATKAEVLEAINSSRIVHIATHGLLEDMVGLGTPGALALAPSGQDLGYLTANEILDLQLTSELVVLSACDTAQGEIKSDGVIGLSRSFIAAGTPSIIVTLWKVPDDSTAFLMGEFYRHLEETGDKAIALRQAMLSTLVEFADDPDDPSLWATPNLWAAPTFIGESI
jgi:CHAT domain-containing protein